MSQMSDTQLHMYGDTLREIMEETDGFVDKNSVWQKLSSNNLKPIEEEKQSNDTLGHIRCKNCFIIFISVKNNEMCKTAL